MRDQKYTEDIKDYLDLPEDKRDVIVGANLLLKSNNNKHFYILVIRRPDRYKSKLFYELGKVLLIRTEADTIKSCVELANIVKKEITPNIADKKYEGKRKDHDELPEHIKALYVEIPSLNNYRRNLHLAVKHKSSDIHKPCERHEELQLLVSVDKKLKAHWTEYDHFDLASYVPGPATPEEIADSVTDPIDVPAEETAKKDTKKKSSKNSKKQAKKDTTKKKD